MFRVGVLASGTGTNLQAILDTVHGCDGIEVVGVASNRAKAQALDRARRAGVDAASFLSADYADRPERDRAVASWLADRKTDLVVLAGYMELVSHGFLATFPMRVINVHPALLPSFPGLHAVEQQLQYGVKVGGVTVHFVDEGVDTGPIILQQAVEIPAGRDLDETLERLHEVEHRLLPTAIRSIAAGSVSIDSTNPRLVRVEKE